MKQHCLLISSVFARIPLLLPPFQSNKDSGLLLGTCLSSSEGRREKTVSGLVFLPSSVSLFFITWKKPETEGGRGGGVCSWRTRRESKPFLWVLKYGARWTQMHCLDLFVRLGFSGQQLRRKCIHIPGARLDWPLCLPCCLPRSW